MKIIRTQLQNLVAKQPTTRFQDRFVFQGRVSHQCTWWLFFFIQDGFCYELEMSKDCVDMKTMDCFAVEMANATKRNALIYKNYPHFERVLDVEYIKLLYIQYSTSIALFLKALP